MTAPATPPVTTGDVRTELAELFLQGDGVEIGALHLAMALPPGARARYVDRMSVTGLRKHYPELSELDLTPVDVIDDGETLATIAPGSVDFVVANHFLEHCQDPIRTIQTHLSKLRPGGTLFYAVPDKRFTFDFQRPRTTLEHVITDHEHGPTRSREEHYLEWARLVHPTPEAHAPETARRLEAEDYSIHFHVWTESDLVALMFHIHERLGGFEVEAVRRHGIENIVVLRKHGERPAPATTIASIEGDVEATDARSASTRIPVPLAGLRCRLDHGSAAGHWSVDPDGLRGRAWVIEADAPVTVPLALDGPVALKGRAQLLPHDWRDGIVGVDVSALAFSADGRSRQLWASRMTPASDLAGSVINCRLPADTIALQLTVRRAGAAVPRSIGRAAIVEPILIDPRSANSSSRLASTRASLSAVDGPLISVLCPVHDPPLGMLEEAIESVRDQRYPRWQLVLVDDGSTNPGVGTMLTRYEAGDPRIILTRRPNAGGISVATNEGLSRATGEYIALLDHDDTLDPEALADVAALIDSDPRLDMVYTDEGVLADGQITARHLKPDWSPELFEVAMYTTHLGVYRRSLALELGGFRPEYDGTQDYDFVLRLSDRTDRVAHVPKLRYHWRAHASSTAGGDQAKPYAYTAQPTAIGAHLDRRGIDAEVQHGPAPGLHRIVHRVDPGAVVTIVLAVLHADGVFEAARSWAAQPHPSWRVVMSVPADQMQAASAALRAAGVANSRMTMIEADPARDPAKALIAAAELAHTEYLLLMERILLGLSHDWLTSLLGYGGRDQIAAAGPVVLSEDGRIAHAGIAIPAGLPLPLLHGLDAAAAPSVAMNVTAVDGALLTRTELFRSLGGLDPAAGGLALADYCVRAASEHGSRTVLVPDVRLRTIGPDLATNDLPRLWDLGRRFSETHRRDPYYSPHFRTDRGDFREPTPAIGVSAS